jgi:fatty acid desaturase
MNDSELYDHLFYRFAEISGCLHCSYFLPFNRWTHCHVLLGVFSGAVYWLSMFIQMAVLICLLVFWLFQSVSCYFGF